MVSREIKIVGVGNLRIQIKRNCHEQGRDEKPEAVPREHSTSYIFIFVLYFAFLGIKCFAIMKNISRIPTYPFNT